MTCVQFRWQLLTCVSAQDISWVLGSLLGKTALLVLGCDGEAVLTLTAPNSCGGFVQLEMTAERKDGYVFLNQKGRR